MSPRVLCIEGDPALRATVRELLEASGFAVDESTTGLAGIERALDPAFRRTLDGLLNPYGDGRAAPRIVKVLREVELGPRLVRKAFVDLPKS